MEIPVINFGDNRSSITEILVKVHFQNLDKIEGEIEDSIKIEGLRNVSRLQQLKKKYYTVAQECQSVNAVNSLYFEHLEV